LSALIGYLISDEEKERSLAGDHVIARMSHEIVFESSAGNTRWRHDGFSLLRLYHKTDDNRQQPVQSADGSLVLFLDGEIFLQNGGKNSADGLELACSDPYTHQADHCLDVYLKHGMHGFERLNGSFVIVIYDRRSQELILASDRFGSRPLYYHADSKGIVFGTQLGPVIRFPGIRKELDLQSIFEFFTFQKVLREKTFLEDVNLLPPATVLRFRGGKSELKAYWKMEYRPDYSHSRKEYSRLLAGAVYDAVNARLRGNHRMGLLLSGGLDSRIILAASRNTAAFETITIADRPNREVKTARKIAAAAGCDHHFIPRPADHYASLVDDAVRIGGGMFRFDHAHYIGLFDHMRELCDILFHGFDLEVLFRANNMPRKSYDLLGIRINARALEDLSEDSLVESILKHAKYSMWGSNPKLLFDRRHAKIFESSVRDSTAGVISDIPGDVSIFNRYDWLVVHHRLRYPSALFTLSIRPYMIERSVISDNQLLDIYLGTPPEYRADPMLWSEAISYLDKEIARIADANTGLPALPPYSWMVVEKAHRLLKKGLNKAFAKEQELWYTQGSWPDSAAMIRQNKKLKDLILTTIADADCLDPSLFDTGRIRELANLHLDGREDHSCELLLLVTFGRWHKLYIA
jgi:asparagine synthase (glutamine-hydrolysing)